MLAVEREPAIVATMFGPQSDLVRAFTEALADEGERRGLIGPLELPRLWTRHIINSGLIAPLLRGSIADVGSGAGLPGLVAAIARPDLQFTLVEPMERRVEWLDKQVKRLDLSNVNVLRVRAEEAPKGAFDMVTARAVGALVKLLPITAPLLRSGGELALLKGASVEGELDKASKTIRKHRLLDVRIELLGDGMPTEPTRVFRARVD